MKQFMLILAAVAFSLPAYAGSSADLAPDIYNNTGTTTTNTTSGQTQFPTYVPPAPPPPAATPAVQPGQGSINPAANQGQQSQNGGAGANAAAGAALIAAGMALISNPPTAPAGAALIAMGALALAQSGEDSGAANQSGQTAAASVNGVPSNGAAAPVANPNLGTGTSAYQNPALKDGTAALTAAGYSLTPAGLVNPDGSTVPNSAFNSAGGMAAAGMDAATVAQVQKALGDVNGGYSPAKVSTVAVAEGGGGGSSADHTPGGDYSFTNKGSTFGLSDAAKRAMIAGKTVSFDGDPIGVRGNNIFDMIHVAYQKKRDNHDFLDGEVASGPAMRSPASVAPTPVVVPAKAKAPAHVNINNR